MNLCGMSEPGKDLLFGLVMIAAGLYLLALGVFLARWRRPGPPP